MPSTVPRTRKQLMDVSNDSTHSENIQWCGLNRDIFFDSKSYPL